MTVKVSAYVSLVQVGAELNWRLRLQSSVDDTKPEDAEKVQIDVYQI
jgi:hypothetical protein